jgi:exopolyphosphatase/guanosine-5'-triphosphate,3'-diphosphate pyrophosphatase
MACIESYLSETEQIAVLNKYNVRDIALHQKKVAYCAVKLFDSISQYYKFKEEDRDILYYSALLHDIGCFISKQGHHKHTKYLILREPLLNKIPKDMRILLAFIASGHRKSIDCGIKAYSDEMQLKILQLIALLRVSDALDHTHKLEISLDKIEFKNKILKLSIDGEKADKVIDKFKKKSTLFKKVFNIPIELEYKQYMV